MKLGRQPRKFDPRVPHLSALLAKTKVGLLAPPPASVSWTTVFPNGFNFGMMLNDQLGDCTCAGIHHLRQIWTANANPPTVTDSDTSVLNTYEQVCGYKFNDPSTDNGGVEQDVLTHWLNMGVPTDGQPDQLSAFFEVDVRNLDDVKRTIDWCGAAYIGFEVPRYLMENVPQLWVIQTYDTDIEGGHCVILPGYDSVGPEVVSWGTKYKMTWEFFGKYVDECYGPVSRDWVASTGKTPAGMTVAELESQMQTLKA